MLLCPSCQCVDTTVKNSRPTEDGIKRRRECSQCGTRFSTVERVEELRPGKKPKVPVAKPIVVKPPKEERKRQVTHTRRQLEDMTWEEQDDAVDRADWEEVWQAHGASSTRREQA